MALLARLFTFTPGGFGKSSEVNAELNQLINVFAGVSTDKRILIVTNDNTDPPLRINQQGSALIADFQKGDVSKASIANDGTPTIDSNLVIRSYVAGTGALKTGWEFSIFDGTPAAATNEESPYEAFIVPDDGVFFATKLRAVFKETVAGTDGTQATFALKRKAFGGAVTSLGTIQLIHNTDLVDTVKETDIADVQLAAKDMLYVLVSSVDANYRLRKITVSFAGYSTRVAL